MAELSYQQNILEWAFPYDIKLNLQDILERFVKSEYPEAIEKMKQFGLNPSGVISIARSPKTFNQLNP